MLSPSALNLQAEESKALLGAMQPFFAQDGIDLVYDKPTRWLARGEVFAGLCTASPYRVIGSAEGKSVDSWLPRDAAAKPLRRLQQEMQMLLYTHPLTDARSERGALAVNSFWVSGTGAMTAEILVHPQTKSITTINTLRDTAINGDWAAWRETWTQIDANECAAMLQALQRKVPVTLTLCGERNAQIYGDLSDFHQSYYKSSKYRPNLGKNGILAKIRNFLSPQLSNNIISSL